VVVGRDADGTGWVTSIGAPGEAAPEVPEVDPVPDDPSAFDVRPSRPPAEWCDAVAEATARIRAGELDKVVLAREVVVTADRPISVGGLLRRLRSGYPGCFLYAVDGYVGASPELLVGRRDDAVRAQPMAGTTARRGDPDIDAAAADALFASTTYRHEHQVTIDMVHDTLLRFSSYIDYEPEPSVVPLANVQHLATQVEGRLSHPPASVLELVQALHPTPAVCGRPRDRALAVIAELEGFDRGRYGGAVGWVDAAGNGTWAVAIRGAQIEGSTARVYAGNGIVGDSDPATELAETRAKLRAMLEALVRP
jgi:menaquinone-specific isochorismate synthase